MTDSKKAEKAEKTSKKDYYQLRVIFKNGQNWEDKPGNTFKFLGYGEERAKDKAIKFARTHIGKMFVSALLVHVPSNIPEWKISVGRGEETWAEYEKRKVNKVMQDKPLKSLLVMNIQLHPNSQKFKDLIAKGKPAFINGFTSVDADPETGEYGEHIALKSLIAILKLKEWRHYYQKAWIFKDKKNVAWIDFRQAVHYKCPEFEKLMQGFSYSSNGF